jgi:hypothetical protein
MASPQPGPATAGDPDLPPVKLDPLAGILSFLVPGAGQVYQGRVGKGSLFFFGLYLLFFYGMWMGQWRNVWLPDVDAPDLPPVVVGGQQMEGVLKALYYRPQFLGQFWIGVASWPAVYQFTQYDRGKETGPIFGKFERMPKESDLNVLQTNSSKRWDLGWVYTVIAGVLNLLVIYDAFAGPMFRDPPNSSSAENSAATVLPSAAPPALPPPPPTEPAAPVPSEPVAGTPEPGPAISVPADRPGGPA